MLGFGSNLGFIWKFVKCSLLPFSFTYFDLSSSKSSEKYWVDSENKVNKFLNKVLPHFRDFEMFIQEKYFFLNIMCLQYAKFQMANERERNQSHYRNQSHLSSGYWVINIELTFFRLYCQSLWKRHLWQDIWSGRHFCAQTNFSAH